MIVPSAEVTFYRASPIDDYLDGESVRPMPEDRGE